MSETAALGPWPTGMNMLARDASLGGDVRLLVNVDVDDQGRVQARPQTALGVALPGAHSITGFAGAVWGVQSGAVFRWAPESSSVNTLASCGNTPMRWAEYNGELYGVSRHSLVRFSADGAVLPWGQYQGSRDTDGVEYLAPSPADNFAAFMAHLMFVHGRKLSWTPAFQPQVVIPARDFIYMPEDIVLCAPVDTGVWLASANKTWFLQGRVPGQWVLRFASNVGALGADFVARDGAAYWATDRGIAVANNSGDMSYPQQNNVALSADSAPALVFAPWNREMVIATYPKPSVTARTAPAFSESLVVKGE